MKKEDVKLELRKYLNRDGQRWNREYESMTLTKMKDFLRILKRRDKKRQKEIQAQMRKQSQWEPEDDTPEGYSLMPLSPGMYTTGGGVRVIRSTRGLGG